MKVYEILLVDVVFLILAAVAAALALVYCFGVSCSGLDLLLSVRMGRTHSLGVNLSPLNTWSQGYLSKLFLSMGSWWE